MTTPTTDLPTALTRLADLLDTRPGRSATPRMGRWLARQAVYGDLWTPERVGEVPADTRLALRTTATAVIRLVYPGGAYAKSVAADSVRALANQPAPAV